MAMSKRPSAAKTTTRAIGAELGNRPHALHHQDLEAGPGQIAGASEAIMPGADDDGLVPAGHPNLYLLTLNADGTHAVLELVSGYDPPACDFPVKTVPSVSVMPTSSSLSPPRPKVKRKLGLVEIEKLDSM